MRLALRPQCLNGVADAVVANSCQQVLVEGLAVAAFGFALVVAFEPVVRSIVRMQVGEEVVGGADLFGVAFAGCLHGLDRFGVGD